MAKNVVKSLKFWEQQQKHLVHSILLLPRSQCIHNLFQKILWICVDFYFVRLAMCWMSFRSHKHMSDCKRHKNHKKLIKNEKKEHIKFMSFENIMHVQIRWCFFSLSRILVLLSRVKSFFSMSSLLLTGINLLCSQHRTKAAAEAPNDAIK